jgi:hypothetical protein
MMAILANLAIGVAALGFGFMGTAALAAPDRITRQFGMLKLSAAGRNEVRAVYGGFGLAIAGMLVWAWADPSSARMICLTVAAALAGMAAGRLVSAALDRGMDRFPFLYLFIELLGVGLLVFAGLGRAAG